MQHAKHVRHHVRLAKHGHKHVKLAKATKHHKIIKTTKRANSVKPVSYMTAPAATKSAKLIHRPNHVRYVVKKSTTYAHSAATKSHKSVN